jgi:hypothetical protein
MLKTFKINSSVREELEVLDSILLGVSKDIPSVSVDSLVAIINNYEVSINKIVLVSHSFTTEVLLTSIKEGKTLLLITENQKLCKKLL